MIGGDLPIMLHLTAFQIGNFFPAFLSVLLPKMLFLYYFM